MMSKYGVTFLVPTYNRASYLERCFNYLRGKFDGFN